MCQKKEFIYSVYYTLYNTLYNTPYIVIQLPNWIALSQAKSSFFIYRALYVKQRGVHLSESLKPFVDQRHFSSESSQAVFVRIRIELGGLYRRRWICRHFQCTFHSERSKWCTLMCIAVHINSHRQTKERVGTGCTHWNKNTLEGERERDTPMCCGRKTRHCAMARRRWMANCVAH